LLESWQDYGRYIEALFLDRVPSAKME